jgi:hypothetical protein
MEEAVKYTAKLKVVECCQCGMDFGITEGFSKRRHEDHKYFYCPAGHQQHYPQESDVERLERKLTSELARRRRAEAERDCCERRATHNDYRARGFKGAWRKEKNRHEQDGVAAS